MPYEKPPEFGKEKEEKQPDKTESLAGGEDATAEIKKLADMIRDRIKETREKLKEESERLDVPNAEEIKRRESEKPREPAQERPAEAEGSEEIGKVKEASIEEEPEIEKKERIELSAEIFEEAKAKRIFRGLSEKAKEFVFDLYQEAGMTVADRIRIWRDNRIKERHTGKAEKIVEKLKEKENNVSDSRDAYKEHENRLTRLRERFGGKLDRSIEEKALREKHLLENGILEESQEADKLRFRLDSSSEKRIDCQKKIKETVAKDLNLIEKYTRPLNSDLEKLKSRRDTLDAERARFNEERKKFYDGLKELDAEAERVIFGSEKIAYEHLIKKAEKKYLAADKLIRKRSKEIAGLDKRLSSIQKEISHWLNRKGELVKISQEKLWDVEPRPDWIRALRGFKEGSAAESEEAAEETIPGEIKEAIVEKERKKEERPPKMSIKEYAQKWNSYFGSEFGVGEDFEGFMSDKGWDTEEGLDPDRVSGLFRGYYGNLRKEKKTGLKQKRFKGMLELFKIFLGIK